jgi:opacity protein-like surface antigen
MKKLLFIIVIVFTISVPIFSQDFKLGIGGGAIFSIETGTNKLKATAEEQKCFWESFGYFMYFDATFVVFNFTFFRGFTHYETNNADIHGHNTYFDFSLLGKYPFPLGRFTLFPLLGISYRLVVFNELERTTDKKPTMNNIFGLQGGFGTDFALTEKVYFRGVILIDAWMRSEVDKNRYMDDTLFNNLGLKFIIGLGYIF